MNEADQNMKDIESIIESLEIIYNYAGDGMLVNWRVILKLQMVKLNRIKDDLMR